MSYFKKYQAKIKKRGKKMESNSKQALNKLFKNVKCKSCDCNDICILVGQI